MMSQTKPNRLETTEYVDRDHQSPDASNTQAPYASDVIEIGSRAGTLPPPPSVVWESLSQPRRPGTRPWLNLLPDEIDPQILEADKPHTVVWSSIWPSRPNDRIHFDLSLVRSGETSLRFTLLTPDEPPDDSKTGHLRRRLNRLFFADLRYSYGQ